MANPRLLLPPASRVRRRGRADPRGPPALRVAAARAAQRAERPRRAAPARSPSCWSPTARPRRARSTPSSSARTRSTRRRPSTARRSTRRATRPCSRCSRPSELYDEDVQRATPRVQRDAAAPPRRGGARHPEPGARGRHRRGPRPARCRLAGRAQPHARRGLRQPGAGARARRRLLKSVLRGHPAPPQRALPAPLDRQHRHGRRRPAHRGGGAGADLRARPAPRRTSA